MTGHPEMDADRVERLATTCEALADVPVDRRTLAWQVEVKATLEQVGATLDKLLLERSIRRNEGRGVDSIAVLPSPDAGPPTAWLSADGPDFAPVLHLGAPDADDGGHRTLLYRQPRRPIVKPVSPGEMPDDPEELRALVTSLRGERDALRSKIGLCGDPFVAVAHSSDGTPDTGIVCGVYDHRSMALSVLSRLGAGGRCVLTKQDGDWFEEVTAEVEAIREIAAELNRAPSMS